MNTTVLPLSIGKLAAIIGLILAVVFLVISALTPVVGGMLALAFVAILLL